jgi:Ca2+/H+ antiporter, TMEM165/GDT1 family
VDALMAALVAGLLAQAGDRPPLLAAILADRYRSGAAVLAGAALALAAASGLAAAAGALLAGKLTPAAGQLFLALALLFQGAGSFFPAGDPDRLDRWRLGAFGTSAAGLFILAFGDGLQFIVLALAARTPLPWLPAVGASVGALAAVAAAMTLGERGWCALPLRALRMGAGALFLLAGAALALGALRLI